MAEKVVLKVGRFYSHCGACGGNADMHETAHVMERMRGEGCGAVYTHIAFSYMDFLNPESDREAAKRLRPDLEFNG